MKTESVENALKSLYLGVLADQLNTTTHPFLARVEQTTSDVWGKEIRKIAPFRGDKDQYLQYCLELKNLYGSIELSEKALRASEGSVGAFVNLMESEFDSLLKLARFNLGRMLFGDGSGKLCEVLDSNGHRVNVDSTKNLIRGLVVDVFAADGTPILTSRTIMDINEKSVSFNGAPIVDGLIDKGSYMTIQGARNKELTGLGAIFGNGETLYGLNRSDYWQLQPLEAVAVDINDDVIQTVIDTVERKSGSWPDFIICSTGVKRAYQNWLVTHKNNIDIMSLQSGYTAISYNGIPVVADKRCPAGTMYLLNSNDFKLHQLCDWRWLEGDDGRILKQYPNGMYMATFVKYADLMCDRPYAQAVIKGIKEA